MSWSFRKSKSLGPFRVNLSKSGLGFSFGVKGARISTGPRGTFVTVGAGGIYYRKKLASEREEFVHHPLDPGFEPDVVTQTISSTNFENLTDSDSKQFIDDLHDVEKKISFVKWFGVAPSTIILLFYLGYLNQVVETKEVYKDTFTVTKPSINVRSAPSTNAGVVLKATEGDVFNQLVADTLGWVKVENRSGQTGFVRLDLGATGTVLVKQETLSRISKTPNLKWLGLLIFLALIAWCIYMFYLDRKRKSIEVYYEMDDEQWNMHSSFLTYFKEFLSTKKIWQMLHQQRVTGDRKYHAGAGQLITRKTVSRLSINKLPSKFLRTNIDIPYIGMRNIELYFLPERMVLKRGNRFAAVFYKNLEIELSATRFIEEEGVPADAEVVGYTWKYPNKGGGPDKRFKDNRQIPICNYSEYVFKSESGINEIISTSKPGAMNNLVAFIRVIGDHQRKFSNSIDVAV